MNEFALAMPLAPITSMMPSPLGAPDPDLEEDASEAFLQVLEELTLEAQEVPTEEQAALTQEEAVMVEGEAALVLPPLLKRSEKAIDAPVQLEGPEAHEVLPPLALPDTALAPSLPSELTAKHSAIFAGPLPLETAPMPSSSLPQTPLPAIEGEPEKLIARALEAAPAADEVAPSKPSLEAQVLEPALEILPPKSPGPPLLVERPHSPLLRQMEPLLAHHIERQVVEHVAVLEGGETEISLSPEELGEVKIVLRLEEARGNTVSLFFERPETLDLMRRHAEQLAKALESLGYKDVDLSFSSRGQEQETRSHPPPVRGYFSLEEEGAEDLPLLGQLDVRI